MHFPTGRFGEAIEQAHAVVFLASDESSFVNGTDFVVDGGMSKVCYVTADTVPFNLHYLGICHSRRTSAACSEEPGTLN